MRNTSGNVRNSTRTYSIKKHSLCARVMPTDVGRLLSTPVIWHMQKAVGGDYTEGNAWQYTWHVQHDVPGLIELFGGKEVFLNKLDSLFTIELKGSGLADVTGLIGQYAHGNEQVITSLSCTHWPESRNALRS